MGEKKKGKDVHTIIADLKTWGEKLASYESFAELGVAVRKVQGLIADLEKAISQ